MQKKSTQETSVVILQTTQTGRYDLLGGTIIENSAGPIAKTWPESKWTEQPEGRSQNERDRTNCSESNKPRAMSTPFRSRLLFKYKILMTILKDDNGRAANHEEALEDPNLDEYHTTKRREEDETHQPKTSLNCTHSQTNHAANPTVPDRQGQIAVIQHKEIKHNQ